MSEQKREGTILKALSGFYYVQCGQELITTRARGKFRYKKITPLVGDRVAITVQDDGSGSLDEILPRRNFFQRPAVANIDQLVIIASEAIPQTAPYLIDRISASAALKNCEVLVCLNKCDLDPADELFEIYSASAIPVLRISAETGLGMEELKERVAGKLSAFTGNSGVGKSSILNLLDPDFGIAVGEVSQALGRGRHTTRHVEMFYLKECDGYIIDTPGFASFESTELNMELKERLEETFPEFKPYLGECRFVGCNHVKEKGCRVLEAKKEGKIHPVRHASYVRLWEELKPLQDWQQKNK